MVICGSSVDQAAGQQLIEPIAAVVGGAAMLIDTDDYENLTPGMLVLSGGIYSDKEAAQSVAASLKEKGIECYIKQAALKKEAAKGLIFVGDDNLMWFCFSRNGAVLPYSTCVANFQPGSELIRPLFKPEAAPFGQTGRMGHQTVKVNKVEVDSNTPCGEALAEYKGLPHQTQRYANPISSAKKIEAHTREIRAYLENKTGMTFAGLKILRLANGDIDGDGQEEIVVDARCGVVPRSMEVTDNVVSFVGIIDGGKIVDVFLLATPKSEAEQDFYRASIYEHPAGLADVNGDGHLELICEDGYYEGRGLVVYSYRDGVVKNLAANGCGA